MLDTAASMTTINLAYARSIGLPEGFKIEAKGAGGPIDARLVSGLTLDLEGVVPPMQTFGVMKLAPIERGIGMPIAAIFVAISSIPPSFRSIGRQAAQDQLAGRVQAGRRRHRHQACDQGPVRYNPHVEIAGAAPIEALLDLGNGGAR